MAIDATRFFGGGPSIFCFSDTPQTRSGHGIDATRQKIKGFSDLPCCVEGGRAKMQNSLVVIPNAKETTKNEWILICQRSKHEFTITNKFSTVNPFLKHLFSKKKGPTTNIARHCEAAAKPIIAFLVSLYFSVLA